MGDENKYEYGDLEADIFDSQDEPSSDIFPKDGEMCREGQKEHWR